MNEELRVKITAEVDKFLRDMENAREEVEDFGDTGEQSLEDFEKGLESVKQATANAMKVVAGAIAAAALAVVGLAESTREYRTNQAKLTTAFE